MSSSADSPRAANASLFNSSCYNERMLSKEHRLAGHRIPVLLKHGRRVHADIASVIFVENEPNSSHIGIIVPVKLSKRAVYRNRTKRLISEAIRQNNAKIKLGFDTIIMAKKILKDEKLTDIQKPIVELLQRAGLLSS